MPSRRGKRANLQGQRERIVIVLTREGVKLSGNDTMDVTGAEVSVVQEWVSGSGSHSVLLVLQAYTLGDDRDDTWVRAVKQE